MNLARNAFLLSCLCASPAAWADVFEWEYIDPLNPALGNQQSATLAPDGAGATPGWGADLSNLNLTKAYLPNGPLYNTNLTNVNLTDAYLTGAFLTGGTQAAGADFTNADLTGADFSGSPIRRSAVREQWLAALDHWARLRNIVAQDRGDDGSGSEEWWGRPLRLAIAVDPNVFANRVRAAQLRGDKAELRALAESPQAIHLPVATLCSLEAWLDDFGTAASLLSKAQRAKPDDFYLNLELATTHLGPADDASETVAEDEPSVIVRPEGERSLPYAMAAVALRPESAWAWYILAGAEGYAGRWEEAEAAYRRAIALAPSFAAAFNELGDVLNTQGRWEESLAAYRAAIDLQPSTEDLNIAYSSLGLALRDLGRLEESEAALRKAIDLDPADDDEYTNLGNTLDRADRPIEAIAAYRRAIELDPSDFAHHANLAISLLNVGRPEEDLAEYRKAIELEPTNAVLHLNLGCAYSSLGRLEEAVAAYEKVFELRAPRSYRVDAYCCLAHAWKKRGNLDQAESYAKKGMEVDPDDPEPYSILAWILATCDPESRDVNRALDLARRALELAPKDADSWGALGVALYRDGEYAEALEALQKCESLRKRKHAAYGFFLAMTYWRLGDQNEARNWRRKAVELMERRRSDDVELKQFRSEAAELIDPEAPPSAP